MLLYFFFPVPEQPSTDHGVVASRESDSLQLELAKCDQAAEEKMQSACREFMRQWCPMLNANAALQEKAAITATDLGLRIPVLQPARDPFSPLDCYREWWLIEAAFASRNSEDDGER